MSPKVVDLKMVDLIGSLSPALYEERREVA
jgi:hypothetical protein